MSKELKHRVLLCQFLKRKNSLSTTANSSSKKNNSPVTMTEPEPGFQNITSLQIQQSTSINKFMRFSKVRTCVRFFVLTCFCSCVFLLNVRVFVVVWECLWRCMYYTCHARTVIQIKINQLILS